MEKFKTIEVHGRTHVLVEVERHGLMANPDYKKSGMALCGILRKGQDMNDFVIEREKAIDAKKKLRKKTKAIA